jgi:hypothetical protein
MTMLSRRHVLASAASAFVVTGVPFARAAAAGSRDWIEVVGSAAASGPADRDPARRRALADALLSAALAGGAVVKGHSAMSMTRITSDLLVVRPVGRVLGHQVVSEHFDGRIWRITIRAQVGQPAPTACGDRRQMVVTMYPPRIRVSPNAPAWAEAFAIDLGQRLAEMAEAHPAVAQFTRAGRLPNADPSRDKVDYQVLTSGNARVDAGGHGLHCDISIEPSGRDLQFSLRLLLEGPAGERIEKNHQTTVRLPGPSVLGRAAPLVTPDKRSLATKLLSGARPALTSLLQDAGCQPVLARIQLTQQKMMVPVGRIHGLSRTHLAFTVDQDASTEMLEVVKLGERSAVLAPLDPARPPVAFAGRPVRFLDTTERLQ